MLVDARPSLTRGIEGTAAPVGIDFRLPPERIEPYSYGDILTRNNFTGYLIDGFARSRGNTDRHAISIKHLDTTVDPQTISITQQFLNAGGLRILAEDELGLVIDAYSRVRRHKESSSLSEENDASFASIVDGNVKDALGIIDHAGGEMIIGKYVFRVDDFDEEVLRKNILEFMIWLKSVGKDFRMRHFVRKLY